MPATKNPPRPGCPRCLDGSARRRADVVDGLNHVALHVAWSHRHPFGNDGKPRESVRQAGNDCDMKKADFAA
jgi:hypothetical protein